MPCKLNKQFDYNLYSNSKGTQRKRRVLAIEKYSDWSDKEVRSSLYFIGACSNLALGAAFNMLMPTLIAEGITGNVR